MAPRVLVTGANGLLGAAVVKALVRDGHQLSGTVRDLGRLPAFERSRLDVALPIGDMTSQTDWEPALQGVQTVIHTAAANSSKGITPRALTAINVEATARLARQAADAGIQKFVFVSSIKVHGESSGGIPFSETDACSPKEPYALSKLDAEKTLAKVHAETGMQIIIVRPALIYGPGVRGSFYRLLQAADKRIPLPFGALTNRRSMISVANAASLLAACVSATLDPFSLFVAADPEPLSTPDWFRAICVALGRTPSLLRCSPGVLSVAARSLGLSGMYEKLCLSLEVNATKVQEQLGWAPPQSRMLSLSETADWYRGHSMRPSSCAF
jgi:nucleoside-diphosphate-sugar epimerase